MNTCRIIFLLLSLVVSSVTIASERSRHFPNETVPNSTEKPTQRIALVIGVNNYQENPLANPINDARAITDSLKRADFDVSLIENGTENAILDALEDLRNKLKKGGTGLFYFSGHGIQVNGLSHIIPVDARVDERSKRLTGTISLGEISSQMQEAGNKLNILILDACRNVPTVYLQNQQRGLADSNPKDLFIGYATSPGRVAADGSGRNSPYTKHLSRFILSPGLQLNDVFDKTGNAVELETKGGQTPYVTKSFNGDFEFLPAHIDPANTSPDGDNISRENKWFQYIRTIGTIVDFVAFLDKYPDTQYRDELEQLAVGQPLCSILSFLELYPKSQLSEGLRRRAKEQIQKVDNSLEMSVSRSSAIQAPTMGKEDNAAPAAPAAPIFLHISTSP